jgi:hypothetical protein
VLNRVAGVGAGIAVLAAVTCSAACARPDFQYVSQAPGSSGAGQVYFKVPSAWTEFSPNQIKTAESTWASDATAKNLLAATVWQSAYDAAPDPSLTNVLGAGTPANPTVFASLRTLFQQEKPTDATLRDMIVPISTFGSQVQIQTDAKVSLGSAQGVHVVVSYLPAGKQVSETLDQTAVLNGAKNALYLLVVRCSTKCYNKNRDAIAKVTASYTIQEGHHG